MRELTEWDEQVIRKALSWAQERPGMRTVGLLESLSLTGMERGWGHNEAEALAQDLRERGLIERGGQFLRVTPLGLTVVEGAPVPPPSAQEKPWLALVAKYGSRVPFYESALLIVAAVRRHPEGKVSHYCRSLGIPISSGARVFNLLLRDGALIKRGDRQGSEWALAKRAGECMERYRQVHEGTHADETVAPSSCDLCADTGLCEREPGSDAWKVCKCSAGLRAQETVSGELRNGWTYGDLEALVRASWAAHGHDAACEHPPDHRQAAESAKAAAELDAELQAMRKAVDKVERQPGCECHLEVGDSPCPVHGLDEVECCWCNDTGELESPRMGWCSCAAGKRRLSATSLEGRAPEIERWHLMRSGAAVCGDSSRYGYARTTLGVTCPDCLAFERTEAAVDEMRKNPPRIVPMPRIADIDSHMREVLGDQVARAHATLSRLGIPTGHGISAPGVGTWDLDTRMAYLEGATLGFNG